MPTSKALILQGILGVAGLCASGVGGIGLGLGKAFGEVQSDAPAADDSSLPKPKELKDTGEVVDDSGNLGIPEECEGSCSLSEEQLKKLKFEVKEGSSITFEGLDDGDEFELIIEDSNDQINYPKGNKYILKPKTIAGTVTIKNIKEGDIVLGKDQEVVIREVSAGGKLEHLLEEVTELGIPKRCVGEQATQPCELTKLQLQKLNLETRRREAIRVEGPNEGNIVTLTIEDKGDDLNNYPRGKKYSLRSSGYVTIGGVKEGDIYLESGKEFLIRETSGGGKLEHLIEELNELGIPKRCVGDQAPKPCELIQRQLKDLKFEPKEGTSIAVEGWNDKSKFELTIEDKPNDKDNYPQGKKYILKAKTGTATIQNVKEGDIHVWDGKSVVIRETSEGGKLEMAPVEVDELGIPKDCEDSCQLTPKQLKNLQFETKGEEEITVEFLNKAKVVNLKVEDKSSDRENYPQGKKYTLSARTGQVKIKGLKDGDIEIGGEVAVVIREKENEKKLERAPEEIDELGIPRRCESGSTCDLTKEQLEKLKFETNPDSSITVVGLGEGEKVELKIETPSDLTDYPKGKKYTLTAKTGTVTIQNVKGGNIEIGTKEGFVIRGKREVDKLEKVPKEFNELGIPRWCKAEEVLKTSDTRSCEFTQKQLKSLKFKVFEEGSDDVEVTGLTNKITLTISWNEDQNNYPDNKKYSFDNTKNDKDIKITKDGQTVTIEKNKESRFKNNNGQLELVEAKDKGQIEKEKKIKEIREIVKKLGFEGSSTLSIEFSDINNPTKFKETKVVEFSKANNNENDLKKIKFRDLGGGATWVTGLGGWSIKIFLDWDYEASKYPNNMKFSFLNQNFNPFEFKKNNKTVSIPKKTQGTPNTTFKVENYQLVKVS